MNIFKKLKTRTKPLLENQGNVSMISEEVVEIGKSLHIDI